MSLCELLAHRILREQNALWFLARDSDFVMTQAFSCLGVKREASAELQSKAEADDGLRHEGTRDCGQFVAP